MTTEALKNFLVTAQKWSDQELSRVPIILQRNEPEPENIAQG